MAVLNISAMGYAGYRREVLAYGRSLAQSALRLMLVQSTYRFNFNDSVVSSLSAFEISAVGYARMRLTNKAIVSDPMPGWNAADRYARVGRLSSGVGVTMPSDFCCLVADDVTLPTMAAGQTLGGAVLFRDAGSDGASPLIAYFDLTKGGAIALASNTSGSLSFDPSANGGIVRIAEPSGSTPPAPPQPPGYPGTPNSPSPSTDATGSPTLTWAADDATSFDLYFGTANPPPLVASGLVAASYATGTIGAGTYYWRVVARNAVGTTDGPVWTLVDTVVTAPATPNTPSPASDATGSPTLTWAAAGATSYDVYFGTSNPPPLVSSGQVGASYAPTALTVGTYNWKIVAINSVGSTAGPVWTLDEIAGDETVTVLTTTATGTQDNVNAGTLTALNVLRCNNASLLTIRGLTNNGATPSDGTMVWIESVGAGQVDIANQNTGSTAANRIINNVTATISLAAGCGRALLCYDATTARWRVLEHEQGAWIDVPYSSGDFTAGGSMTWTVDSGDVRTFRYRLSGRTIEIAVELLTTTVGGTPSPNFKIAIPGGLLPASAWEVPALYYSDNGSYGVGSVQASAGGGAALYLYKAGLANWSAATNGTEVGLSVSFEVQ